ncbi:MAG: hypothetical protein AAFO76_12885 [Cyanobacteria bacterium J06607_15]
MRGKNYRKLGKTKLVRIPQGIEAWVKQIGRELDEKEDPAEVMKLLLLVASKAK